MFVEELCEKERSQRSYFANDTIIAIQGKNTAFEFFKCDMVFNEKSKQDEVFVPFKILVEDASRGKKCTVFAFG